MKRFSQLLIVALLLVACAGPTAQASAVPENCQLLHTFDDGQTLLLCAASEEPLPGETSTDTETPTPTDTETPAPTDTPTATETLTPTPTRTSSPTFTTIPTLTPTATNTPAPIAPFPTAPLCPDVGAGHDYSKFHTLWDNAQGCHYDHEHGLNPFVSQVAAVFPGFDPLALNCFVQVGGCNPSSPIENLAKHGGMKWDVTLSHTSGCAGRESVPTGVDALVVQYHTFGNYAIEFESRVHSAVGLLRQCQAGNPTDYGYIFVTQHQDYGQRTAPYQGSILPYPDTPLPAYISSREPYFTVDCFGGPAPCSRNASRQAMVNANTDANSTWISEPENIVGSGSPLFFLLFRARDTYQALNRSDFDYPFTFAWMCSSDNGLTYNASMPGCRWNNTTTRVHELGGEIPEAWDNLAGFDTDTRVGRITAEGFVTRFGSLAPACTAPGMDCHPIKMVSAFTGRYGSTFRLVASQINKFHPLNLPERDIYFCGGVQCAEGDPGAAPSGWIGSQN